jgi:hypothetical protein
MNGVEILASAQVPTDLATNWPVFWTAATIIFVILLSVGITTYRNDGDGGGLMCGIACGVFFGLVGGGLFGGIFFATPTDYETQYKVTISDEVLMNEFLEHYEVIGYNGEEFIVKEKANER